MFLLENPEIKTFSVFASRKTASFYGWRQQEAADVHCTTEEDQEEGGERPWTQLLLKRSQDHGRAKAHTETAHYATTAKNKWYPDFYNSLIWACFAVHVNITPQFFTSTMD